MEEKTRNLISDPDENGVRYYSISGPQANSAPEQGRQPLSDSSVNEPVEVDVNSDQKQEQQHTQTDGGAGSEIDFDPARGFDPDSGGGFGAGGSSGFGAGPGGPGKGGKNKKAILIFACILLAVILLGVACSRLDRDTDSQYADLSDDHISVLYITGTISGQESSSLSGGETYNHKWALNRIDDAIGNPNNKGLILFVDSPGGSVYETDELYLKLLEYKNTGRPLYSAMGSMAASGGYYISAPADKIIANRNCWTGSIGVIVGTFYDISELLDKYGIKTQNITSGKNKAMGGMTEPMTGEQKQIFQSLVDEAYEQFVGIVAEGRNMSVSKVKKLADGRIYTAKQALGNGLIDQIGTLEEAVSDMRSVYNLQGCSVSEMKYQDNSFFSSIFSKLSGLNVLKSSRTGDVAALLEMMEKQGEMPISYMSEIQK